MPYKSSLSDEEWKRLEPLLSEILPPKKQTRPANWSKREILDGIFYQLKNGCNWQDLPKDLPPLLNRLLARAGSGGKQEQSRS
jgi:transposase